MRAFVFVCLAAVTLGYVHGQTVTASPAGADAATDNTETSTAESCRTARGQAGSCVGRERCDYGTAHIDFTLYVPNGYTKPCAYDKVCCPPDYVSSPEAEIMMKEPSANDYDFDDDD